MVVPKATEDTITQILTNAISELGISAQSFYEISTPNGYRKPDIYCTNGGTYVIEAKFPERTLIDAISKIENDYLKYSRLLSINGGFAILYPNKLSEPMSPEVLESNLHRYKFKIISMFPESDERPFSIQTVDFEEIPRVIADQVKHVPIQREPVISDIVATLRDSAVYLVNGLANLAGSDLISFFGGENVFKNILEHKEDKHTIEEMRLAASYLLINQLLFYRAISKLREGFDLIDPDLLNSPEDLLRYFKKVTDINYKVVFSYQVAPLIPKKFLPQIRTIIGVINGVKPEKVGGELLGMIFHDLIPLELRKKVAAWYTNLAAAKLLANLVVEEEGLSVADFSCGSGGLLVSAYNRKKELSTNFNFEKHRTFVEEQLLGVDVMPFAANVAACNLSLQSPNFFTNKIQIAIWDSTDLEVGKVIPSVSGIQTSLIGQQQLIDFNLSESNQRKGVVSIGEERGGEIELKEVDVAMMNPPFTRQERLPDYYKSAIKNRFNQYERYISTQMSFYGYFMLLADKFLKDRGRMGFIIPAAVLVVMSSEGIRKLLAEKYIIEYIITTRDRFGFSESSSFKEVILIAKKVQDSQNSCLTKLVFIKQFPGTINEANTLSLEMKNSKSGYESGKIRVIELDYAIFRNDLSNWYRTIALDDVSVTDRVFELLKNSDYVYLSALSKDIPRGDLGHFKIIDFQGYLINDASRADKKNDIWIIEEENDKFVTVKHKALDFRFNINKDKLRSGIRKISGVRSYSVEDFHDYVIVEYFDEVEKMASCVLDAKSKGFSELRETLRMLKWKKKADRMSAHLLISRRPFLASPGTYFVSFYSENKSFGVNLFSVKGISKDSAKILTLWLNSSFSLVQMLYLGASRDGNWTKLDQYMVNDLKVPAVELLEKEDKVKLLKLFEDGKKTEPRSIYDQFKYGYEFRIKVDELFLRILKKSSNSSEEIPANFISRMHETIFRELDALKNMSQN